VPGRFRPLACPLCQKACGSKQGLNFHLSVRVMLLLMDAIGALRSNCSCNSETEKGHLRVLTHHVQDGQKLGDFCRQKVWRGHSFLRNVDSNEIGFIWSTCRQRMLGQNVWGADTIETRWPLSHLGSNTLRNRMDGGGQTQTWGVWVEDSTLQTAERWILRERRGCRESWIRVEEQMTGNCQSKLLPEL
jgi:hypothetical protein